MATITANTTGKKTVTAPAARVTRTLLAAGAVAGPLYVLVSVAQGLTRDGFDFTRHAWSLLANGELGWIQITNLVVAGLLTMALAAALRRLPDLGGWAPRLIGVYGASLIAAGAFRADPALGFPAGTPDDATTVSWHGMLHFAAGGIGFACLIAASFVLGRHFAAAGRRGWAAFSRTTGALFLAGFVAMSAGAGNTVGNLAFTAAILLVWAWLSALSVHLRKHVPNA
ncbi:DUF998 domain-containing protein [Actinomadura rudentiformis]|uniref:DUF998 domain-containing protein n=1 Tax=Actinomadura rudentiformis TaxID=359158 RepID=A0A6H9YY57_9ACTN|nr:DUF998 domain-containing protein [Actinomadura rudentiformis]KAB2351453.1 DUF998 domain-containing protein [Actinomadura rudentiformis]